MTEQKATSSIDSSAPILSKWFAEILRLSPTNEKLSWFFCRPQVWLGFPPKQVSVHLTVRITPSPGNFQCTLRALPRRAFWATDRVDKFFQCRVIRENVQAGRAYSRRKFLRILGDNSPRDAIYRWDPQTAFPFIKPHWMIYNTWVPKARWGLCARSRALKLGTKSRQNFPTQLWRDRWRDPNELGRPRDIDEVTKYAKFCFYWYWGFCSASGWKLKFPKLNTYCPNTVQSANTPVRERLITCKSMQLCRIPCCSSIRKVFCQYLDE